MMEQFTRRLYGWLSSRWFFGVVAALFVASAVWIVFTGRYPMAYDEDFHLGIIKLYAQQWSPFFASQPAGADQFGAVVRDPSFLHHYLLSFPYRLIDRLTQGNLYWTVIALRLINVAFLAASLFLYRKALLALKASPAVTNVVLLFFVLTPVVPYLGAQINYDNLLILIAGFNFWLAIRVVQTLRAGRLPVIATTALLAGCMLASLVKYSYLPIFLALVLGIMFAAWKAATPIKKLLHDMWRQFTGRSYFVKTAIVAVLVVAGGLFTATYGYNVVRYMTPAPECDQVLNVERCKAYGAWNRNYMYAQDRQPVSANPVSFSWSWGATYMNSLFFAVNGIYSGFILGPPLLILFSAAVAVLFGGALLVMVYARKLFAEPGRAMLGFVILVYVGVLWVQNYGEFIHLGQHVAEQGRYVLVVLPFAYFLVVSALRYVPSWRMRADKSGTAVSNTVRLRKLAAVAGCLLVFTQGGGVLTYVARSNPDWWWQQDRVIQANQTLQRLAGPVLYTYWPHVDPIKRAAQ